MKDPFFISDLHFGHENVLKFEIKNARLLRPEFHSIEEMDMKIIENWNSVVGPSDKVYVLGDVCFNKKKMRYFSIMNGTKILIRGNHDYEGIREYIKYFKDIRGVAHLNLDGFKCVLTHVPIHPQCLDRWGTNIHGHLHSNNIHHDLMDLSRDGMIDKRYFNVSVEQPHIKYTPIRLSAIRKQLGL